MSYQVFKAGPKKGQPKTLTDRVIRYLIESQGMREVPMPASKKFREFTRGGRSYFVGKAGAVKAGKTVSNSISLTDYVHKMMKIWEKLNLPE